MINEKTIEMAEKAYKDLSFKEMSKRDCFLSSVLGQNIQYICKKCVEKYFGVPGDFNFHKEKFHVSEDFDIVNNPVANGACEIEGCQYEACYTVNLIEEI